MNCQKQNLTITLLIAVALLIPQRPVCGQDSRVNFHEEPRITGGLLTRAQLKRIIGQPASSGNPLRRSDEASLPPQQIIKDTSVAPVAWQEKPASSLPGNGFFVNQNPVSADSGVPKVDSITAPKSELEQTLNAPQPSDGIEENESPEIFGPMPWEELVSSWQKWTLMTEGSVGEIETEINQKQEEVDASLGIDPQADEERNRQLKLAREAVNQSKQRIEKKDEYRKRIAEFPNTIEALRREARNPLEPRMVDHSIPVDEMQARLNQLQSELDHGNTQLLKSQEQIQNRDTRMKLIPAEILAARDNANEIHNQILQKQAEGADNLIEVLRLRAQEIAANSEVQLREEEQKWHELSHEALPLEKAIFQRVVQNLEKEISQWNQAIDKRRQLELDEQVRIAKQKAIKAHPALRELLQKTTTVAESRKALAGKISILEDEKLKVTKQLSKVKDQHQNLEQSLADVGKDDSRAELVDVHRNLIQPFEGMARVRKLKHELQQTNTNLRQLRNELEQVNDSATFIEENLKIGLKVADQKSGSSLFSMAEESVDLHRQQLNDYIKDVETFRGLLDSLLTNRNDLQEKIAITRELVDTNMLWVQSADPISFDVLHVSNEGAHEFFDPVEWAQLGDSVVCRVRERPYESAIGIFGLMVAFAVGRKFRG